MLRTIMAMSTSQRQICCCRGVERYEARAFGAKAWVNIFHTTTWLVEDLMARR